MRAALRPKLRRCLRELHSMLYGPLARPLVAAGSVASGPYSIVPAANSTLGARGPADLSTITQTATHTVAAIEFLGNAHTHTHTRARTLLPTPATESVAGVWSITTPS